MCNVSELGHALTFPGAFVKQVFVPSSGVSNLEGFGWGPLVRIQYTLPSLGSDAMLCLASL